MSLVQKVYTEFFGVSIFTRLKRGATDLCRGLWGALMRARRISRERDQLLQMSARMLADIGLSPGDAQIEGSRSFWDLGEPSRLQALPEDSPLPEAALRPAIEQNSACNTNALTEAKESPNWSHMAGYTDGPGSLRCRQ
jgi:uncharacterized protein YjiS (DUF1127 family)